ncbi:unnamed protein product [Arctogadus glacialis]
MWLRRGTTKPTYLTSEQPTLSRVLRVGWPGPPFSFTVRFFNKEKKEFGEVVNPFRPVQEGILHPILPISIAYSGNSSE